MKHRKRPDWTKQMILLARFWAKRSTCIRDQVGAVIYDPMTKAIISIGYNDTPLGWTDCGDGGCEECQKGKPVSQNLKCTCVHAELNALLLAAQQGHSTHLAYLAVTRRPCPWCLIAMRQAGIQMVFWPEHREIESMMV